MAATLKIGAGVPATQVDLRTVGLVVVVAWAETLLEFGPWQVGADA